MKVQQPNDARARGQSGQRENARADKARDGRRRCDKRARKLHALIDTFATAVEVAAFDAEAAAEFGRIGNVLAERGTPIGEFDVLIAAHAVALRCTLVSNNTRHFSRVPGLSVENWATLNVR
jgi:tRNA(fMet)-specific endonuclease VapC